MNYCERHTSYVTPTRPCRGCLEADAQAMADVRTLDDAFGTSWHMSTRDITHTVWAMGFKTGELAPRAIGSGVSIGEARAKAAAWVRKQKP